MWMILPYVAYAVDIVVMQSRMYPPFRYISPAPIILVAHTLVNAA